MGVQCNYMVTAAKSEARGAAWLSLRHKAGHPVTAGQRFPENPVIRL